jgi:DNA polymerase III delta subunit
MLLGDEAQDAIARHVGGGEWVRMNTDSFRAPEAGPGSVVQASRQVPLFSGHRLVVYSQWEKAGRAPDREKQAWFRYLESPSPSTCLVVRTQLTSRELERKGKFFAQSLRHMTVVDLWHPFPRDAAAWATQRGEVLGLQIAPEAVQFLVDHVGPDLLTLRNELEKLSLLLEADPSHPKKLDLEVLGELKARGFQASSWDCIGSLVEGRTLQALRFLPSAREEDRPTGLAWKIQYQALRKVLEGDRRWGTRLLRDCYHWERDLKTGRWPGSFESLALEVLFLRAHRRARGRPGSQSAGMEFRGPGARSEVQSKR